MTKVELRDPLATYHKLTLDELQALSPSFSWPEYFAAIGLPNVKSIIVAQPQFISEFEVLLKSEPIDTWKLSLIHI